MAPERNKTTNQQGRQRSCGECAKAKRRCDLGQPSCFRCTRQKLTCSYPFPSLTNVDSAEEGETPIASEDSSNDLFPLDVLMDQAPQHVETLNFEFNSGTESINGLLNGNTGEDTGEETMLPRARSAYVLGKQFPGVNLSAMAYSRIGYGIEQLKVAVSSMVLATQTPWSHPLLYEDFMPRCLQDAHAACALNIATNDQNAIFIAAQISDRITELISSPTPTAPLEVLARAHSLLLYQIIQEFSEHMRHCGQADITLQYLEFSTDALKALLQNEADHPFSPIPLYPASAARSAWKSFIFRESCRRTLLVHLHCLTLCYLLRNRLSCNEDIAVGTRVTISARLWKASSAFDFAVVWNEKKHVLVKDCDLTQVLEGAQLDDLDVFERMMLVGYMGMDDVKGWFHTRGGTF